MLLHLFDDLPGLAPAASLFSAGDTLALRAALAAVVSLLLVLAFGPRWIGWLRQRFREPIKSASADVERLHQAKQATPTMGGIFVVGALLLSTTLWADWTSGYLPIALLLTLALAAIGAVDDLIKLHTTRRGLSARAKFLAQSIVACIAALAVYRLHAPLDRGLELALPLTGATVHLGVWFVPLATLVIVGFSNAVNLSDGLDGLAGGCLLWAVGGVALISAASGSATWAAYLGIPHIAGAAEMAVLAGATLGALLGFLWFNCHPASVFMGNTGALPLGGLLGFIGVVARQELLLLVIGGVFVGEALSVILQVGSFRLRRKRIFLCAPLHHHFQLRGWSEDKIVVRFWIAAALCALCGLSGLKLRATDKPSLTQLAVTTQQRR